jgi:hypothetical protein
VRRGMFCVPEDSHLQGCSASQFGYCTDDSLLVAKADILLASCTLCCTTEMNTEVKLQVHPGASIKITVLWELCRVVSWKLKDVSDVLTASIIRAMSKPRAKSRLKKQDSLGLGQYLAAPMDKGEGENKRLFLIGILTRYYSIWNVQNPFTKKWRVD